VNLGKVGLALDGSDDGLQPLNRLKYYLRSPMQKMVFRATSNEFLILFRPFSTVKIFFNDLTLDAYSQL
jgi:hypothetical protein